MFSQTLEIGRTEEVLEHEPDLADGTWGLISWLCLGVGSSAGPWHQGSALGLLETAAVHVFGIDSWCHS